MRILFILMLLAGCAAEPPKPQPVAQPQADPVGKAVGDFFEMQDHDR